MMEIERFRPYWKRTRGLAFAVIGIWLLISLTAICFAGLLNEFRLFGFPVGLLVMGQLVIVMGVALMFWFVGAQDRVDEYYGANEDL